MLLRWRDADIPQMRYVSGFAEGPAEVKIDRPVTQATIIIGSPAIDRADKDYRRPADLAGDDDRRGWKSDRGCPGRQG